MTDKQPDALALAAFLEQFRSFPGDLAAAAELRRLHAELVESDAMREKLSDILRRTATALKGEPDEFDLTIIDFARWGMGGATMRLRDTAHDGMNLMYRLHERQDWIAPEPGREHHKHWHQLLTHPDAKLIEAAPDLLTALQVVLRDYTAVHDIGDVEMQPAIYQARAAIAKATGGAA